MRNMSTTELIPQISTIQISQNSDEHLETPIEIESICMNCHENGITKLITANIPFYKQVIVMSFFCEHCGYKNSDLQSGEPVQEFGTDIVLKVRNQIDLNRTVVRSEYATIEIPELELTIPPKSNSGGVLMNVRQDLEVGQKERNERDSETAQKIDDFIKRLNELLNLTKNWTLKLHDPSGNCFIQNLDPMHVDPGCITSHYCRPMEENRLLGLVDDFENPLTEEELEEREWKSYEDVKNEVLYFPGTCQACGALAQTRMKPTGPLARNTHVRIHDLLDIPYFQTVIIMSTDCERCGFKSNEVKSGNAIKPQGCKLSVRIEEEVDLARDVLKSDTCNIELPEFDVEIGAGALTSKFTTVEGLLTSIREHLAQQSAFFVGDSSTQKQRQTYTKLLNKLDDALKLKTPCTLILDDPAGNSYIMSLSAPLDDCRLQKEFYSRTFEQNDELGLNDMKVENYEEMESIQEEEEPN